MFKYTLNTLKKLEDLYKASGYLIRYEKGNFKAGYCILEDKKIVVVNKYYSVEAKINCLIDILAHIKIDEESLTDQARSFLEKTMLKD